MQYFSKDMLELLVLPKIVIKIGHSVYYSRPMVLGFSFVLLYSLYQIIKIEIRSAFSFLSVLF